MTFEELRTLPLERQKEEYERLNKIRDKSKTSNYSLVYGIGVQKLSKEIGFSVKDTKKLIEGYRKKNWAVNTFASSIQKKVINGQTWVFNPLSKFWYTLRNEKDVFSVVNQSAGDYFFNRWLFHIIKRRPQISAQFHDSYVGCLKEGHREEMTKLLLDALKDANEEMALDIPIGCDVKYGKNYGFEK